MEFKILRIAIREIRIIRFYLCQMNCFKCGQSIACNPGNNCWCESVPALNNFDLDQSCYCKDCLIEALSKEVNENRKCDNIQMKKIAKLGLPIRIKENVDYTINEEGLYIFTPWYLMRRGHCCDNKCTNCPY